MKPASFKYALARSTEEAVALLGHGGEDAIALAGGQSLIPMMNFRIARPSFLVDLNKCDDLDFIVQKDDGLRIGAMTRQRRAELDPLVRRCCPLISMALSTAGPVPIRNRGTVGGSIANGYPLAELITVATCLDARITIVNGQGSRTMGANSFFVSDMVTSLDSGDLLCEITIPVRKPVSRYAIRKSGNHASGAPRAIIAAYAETAEKGGFSKLQISIAGLDGRPMRCHTLEKLLMPDNLQREWRDAFQADLDARDFIETNEESADAERLAATLLELVLADVQRPVSDVANLKT